MKNYKTVLIYSLAHFLVDFSCAVLIFEKVYGSGQLNLPLLFYNFCAFALQMPFGLLADRWNKNAIVAAVGCVVVAMAYGFGSIPVMAVVLAGVGNGLFHIGGGIDVLNISTEKAAPLGVFVSPGAFGIYFGTIWGKQNTIPVIAVIIALLAMMLVILGFFKVNKPGYSSNNLPVSFQGLAVAGVIAAILCLFLVVCLRSYVGMTLNFSWKSQSYWGLILICAIVFGKMSGGFLADRFSAVKASVLSLGLAIVLFLFSGYPVAGVLAVFFFNMTMPITLWAVARIMKGCKGFSFGLLTFGLFIGLIPVYLGVESVFAVPLGFAVASFVSLGLLIIGLRKSVA